jgi:hypothetical protein
LKILLAVIRSIVLKYNRNNSFFILFYSLSINSFIIRHMFYTKKKRIINLKIKYDEKRQHMFIIHFNVKKRNESFWSFWILIIFFC